MKAIVELTKDEYRQTTDIYNNLREKLDGKVSSIWFDNFDKRSGYAHYKFSGKVSTRLTEKLGRMPTTTEIIILVDGGFSHFGATCSLTTSGFFTGRVNID